MDFVTGDSTGLALPAHAEALRSSGTAFLTEAFRSYGYLAPDNAVTAITAFEPFAGGNSGQKLLLSLDYVRAEPGLHRDLFVKFSRDFDDPFRDRRRYELEAEVRLAKLSGLPAFPVAVPVAAFADFHRESGTGLLIAQRIAFGTNGIQPLRPKCMDHELADPLAHYRAIFTALGRLVAAHKSGRLSPQVEQLFPFDQEAVRAELPIVADEARLREQLAHYAAFAGACPQLLPANVTTPDFLARMETDAIRLLRHEAAIRHFLYADPDFIALMHWNANIDNAWFWHGGGALECGLLDWGMVRQMNIANGLWSALSGAERSLWDNHLDQLLALFAATVREQGGPSLDPERLKLHLTMAVAMLGLALLMDTPALVLSRLPEAAQASGPLDPILFRNEVARSFLHVFTSFLNLWETQDFGAGLDRLLKI